MASLLWFIAYVVGICISIVIAHERNISKVVIAMIAVWLSPIIALFLLSIPLPEHILNILNSQAVTRVAAVLLLVFIVLFIYSLFYMRMGIFE